MHKRIFYLTVLIMLIGMAVTAQAVDKEWNGLFEEQWDYNDLAGPTKWYTNWAPNLTTLPDASDNCWIAGDRPNGPVIDGITVSINKLEDKAGTSSGDQTITMRNGANLETNFFYLGQINGDTMTFTMESTCGTLKLNGTSDIGYEGNCLLHMDGGILDVNGTLGMGSTSNDPGEGHLQLDGGTITFGLNGKFSIAKNPDEGARERGSLDITGGSIVLPGDWREDQSEEKVGGVITQYAHNFTNIL